MDHRRDEKRAAEDDECHPPERKGMYPIAHGRPGPPPRSHRASSPVYALTSSTGSTEADSTRPSPSSIRSRLGPVRNPVPSSARAAWGREGFSRAARYNDLDNETFSGGESCPDLRQKKKNDPSALRKIPPRTQVFAALDHPHIAQSTGSTTRPGVGALVIELVETDHVGQSDRTGSDELKDVALPGWRNNHRGHLAAAHVSASSSSAPGSASGLLRLLRTFSFGDLPGLFLGRDTLRKLLGTCLSIPLLREISARFSHRREAARTYAAVVPCS